MTLHTIKTEAEAHGHAQPIHFLTLDTQMCFSLYSASLSMTKVYQPLLAKLKLTYPQYLVLLALWQQDSLMVSALSERLFLDSGTLTPLLKRLEKLAYLTRQRSAEDGRCVIVSLTALGKTLRETARDVPLAVACKTGCSSDELMALNTQLQKLRATLTK